MESICPTAFFLVGATATGKTAVAQLLAERQGCALVSADAMLVYRGMDIGTAKPTAGERGDVTYFGLDLVDPCAPFSVGDWLRAVRPAFTTPVRPPIVAGGTGLYVRTLLCGLDAPAADPAARAHWQALFAAEGVAGLRRILDARAPGALARLADPLNPRRLIRALERLDAGDTALPAVASRPCTSAVTVGLRLPRPALRQRIRQRAEAMFERGLGDEVRQLRERFPEWSDTARAAIGYAEAAAWVDNQISLAEAIERVVRRTNQLAKRQETWFRHQIRVVWVDADPEEPPTALAARVANLWEEYGPAQIREPGTA